jgi:beta-phosphoglucomutase-like phosphatase (HAD superfamily)
VIEAVIFDVDGTLVDSVDLHARAWVEAFRDYAIAIKFEDMRRQIGKGGDQIVRMFLSDQQIANFGERLEQHRAELLKDRYIPQIEPLPGSRALFEHLLRNGKKIALASSAKEDELAKYKQIACIDDLIDTETSSDDANNSKPHPDIFEAALNRLGMKPDELRFMNLDCPLVVSYSLPLIGLLQIDGLVAAVLVELGAPYFVQALVLGWTEADGRPQPHVEIAHGF